MPRGLTLRLPILVAALAGAACFTDASHAGETVSSLDGKLTLAVPKSFVADDEAASPESIAGFKAKTGDAWGTVIRGRNGLQPEGLSTYLEAKVSEYTGGLAWLPKLVWLERKVIEKDGRQWVDLRFIAPREKAKSVRDGVLYTRILATSYRGQLLEILFSSNTDPNPATKGDIDKIIESVKLED